MVYRQLCWNFKQYISKWLIDQIENQRGILKYFHLNDNKSRAYPNLGYMIKAELGRGRFISLFAYSRDG